MKFFIGKLKENLKVLMNRLGYHQFFDNKTGLVSYIRRLSGLDYPRFHVYINEKNDGLEFNLHFDEKKPSYQGYHAHSGEYDSPLVQEELERIKNYIESL